MTVPDRILDVFLPRNIPLDIKLVVIWTIFTIITIYIPPLSQTPVRVILALPMILFIPGYSLIAALFPSNKEIDLIERIALSFGLSIAIVPLIGLALNYTPWGIRLDPVVAALVFFTLSITVVALVRRREIPEKERFTLPVPELIAVLKTELQSDGKKPVDRILNIILVIAIAVAIFSTIYVIAVPKEGEKFTEFYILGKGGMAADYLTTLRINQPDVIIIGIGNHEYRNVTYFVEVWLVDTEFDFRNNTSVIRDEKEISNFSVNLAHNSTYQESHALVADEKGYNQLKFLLFADSPPPPEIERQERINQSYRDLHLWIDVRDQRS
ncbi:MAG TPA: DUF1616 domain-containing protein [Methanoregulaceae archaeon]|nr:DUF1616 domain-containing protein [Methanoregulaceae archaeon]